MQCLKCWGPKLKWIGYIPTFPINQYELVECNQGLQVCSGGCNYCVNVTGSFVAKSCAGDRDDGLKILGLKHNHDGCRAITKAQNKNYTKWLNLMIGKLPNYSVSADFSQACRCSWDGCNASQEDNFHVEFAASSFLSSSKNLILPIHYAKMYVIILTVVRTCI